LLTFKASVLALLCPSLPKAFVCDIVLLSDEVKIIELNHFYHKTGACLFDWKKDETLLLGGTCAVHLVNHSHTLQEAKKEVGDLKEMVRVAATAEQHKSKACVVA
jgi:hypothetical protein